MITRFVVVGYLISVDQQRLVLKVDPEYVDRIAMIKTMYKKSDNLGNFITINAKSASYDITNLDWKDPSDLIGVHLCIKCNTRTYNMMKDIPRSTDSREGSVHRAGVVSVQLTSFMAQTITNTP